MNEWFDCLNKCNTIQPNKPESACNLSVCPPAHPVKERQVLTLATGGRCSPPSEFVAAALIETGDRRG